MTEEKENTGTFNEKQLVVFRLQDEEFGVNINEVKEIMKLEAITQIPNAQHFVEGVINLRGKIIVVIDLAKKLGMVTGQRTKNTRIIIIERGETTVGMIVDSASEVLRITSDKIKPAPELIRQKIKGDYIEGVGILGERLLILLNLGMVLQGDDVSAIGEIERIASVQQATSTPEPQQPSQEPKKEEPEVVPEQAPVAEAPKEEHIEPEVTPEPAPQVEVSQEAEPAPKPAAETAPVSETPAAPVTPEAPKEEHIEPEVAPEQAAVEEPPKEEKFDEHRVEESSEHTILQH